MNLVFENIIASFSCIRQNKYFVLLSIHQNCRRCFGASLSLSNSGEEENTIFGEKGEGENKDRCLSEINGHDDAAVALSEIESRPRETPQGPRGPLGWVCPPFPKRMKPRPLALTGGHNVVLSLVPQKKYASLVEQDPGRARQNI